MPYKRGMNSPDLDTSDGSLVTLADLYGGEFGQVRHLAMQGFYCAFRETQTDLMKKEGKERV